MRVGPKGLTHEPTKRDGRKSFRRDGLLRTGVEYTILRQASQSLLYPEIAAVYTGLLCRW